MSETKLIVDVAGGGSIITKTYEEAYELMKKLASNHHQMVYDKMVRKSTTGILQMEALNTLSIQVSTLNINIQI